MAEALAKKKKIRSGHRASATRMVNRVGETIAAYKDDPTMELDIKGLLQLKTQSGREIEHTEEVGRRDSGVGGRWSSRRRD